MERWDEIATAQKPLMEQHTPHTYLELLGQAEGAEIEPHALFLLATEYEISMESFGDRGKPMSVGDKCTGLLTHNIENDELGGLPTCVILREILTFPTALAAATWLRSIPRAVPNAYMSV